MVKKRRSVVPRVRLGHHNSGCTYHEANPAHVRGTLTVTTSGGVLQPNLSPRCTSRCDTDPQTTQVPLSARSPGNPELTRSTVPASFQTRAGNGRPDGMLLLPRLFPSHPTTSCRSSMMLISNYTVPSRAVLWILEKASSRFQKLSSWKRPRSTISRTPSRG